MTCVKYVNAKSKDDVQKTLPAMQVVFKDTLKYLQRRELKQAQYQLLLNPRVLKNILNVALTQSIQQYTMPSLEPMPLPLPLEPDLFDLADLNSASSWWYYFRARSRELMMRELAAEMMYQSSLQRDRLDNRRIWEIGIDPNVSNAEETTAHVTPTTTNSLVTYRDTGGNVASIGHNSYSRVWEIGNDPNPNGITDNFYIQSDEENGAVLIDPTEAMGDHSWQIGNDSNVASDEETIMDDTPATPNTLVAYRGTTGNQTQTSLASYRQAWVPDYRLWDRIRLGYFGIFSPYSRIIDADAYDYIRDDTHPSFYAPSYAQQPTQPEFISNHCTAVQFKTDTEAQAAGACPTCLDVWSTNNQNIVRTPCEHLFHQDCLQSWLNQSHTCPVCRHDFNV